MGVTVNSIDPQHSYQQALDQGVLLADRRQSEVVAKLQNLHERLIDAETPSQVLSDSGGFFGSLFGGKSKAVKVRETVSGLYLWGGVGRGKTLLCDMFFEGLPLEKKKRMHFHRFMREVHQQLGTIKHTASPLDIVADRFAANNRLLVLDEMHVNDITDAMLMGGLLHGLFSRGVTVVTTSNVLPDDLYKDGLQRSRFLPAIEKLKQHTDVVFLGGDVDYRMRILQNAEIYHAPLDESSRAALESYFYKMVGACSSDDKSTVNINDREIDTILLADGVVWFTFSALCETTRSTDDYIEIGQLFHTVLISDVPRMDSRSSDAARRFINMIDEFYDRKVKVVITAEEPPEQLYDGERLRFEFDRTASRLREMQSLDYLGSQHQP